MTISIWISAFSLLVSFVAVYFTFKKDAHRIRVKQRTFSARSFDAIAINNDSSSSVKLSAVGHLNEVGTITWPREFSDAETNRPISFPAVIEGRSTLFGMVTHNVHIFPEGSVYGFCAQLSCGRAFVMTRNLPTWKAIELKTKALVSWISSGKWGFQMNDTQYRPYLQR